MDSYCVKCKTKTATKNEKIETLANGRNAARGECAVCGTKKCRIVGKDAAPKAAAKKK